MEIIGDDIGGKIWASSTKLSRENPESLIEG